MVNANPTSSSITTSAYSGDLTESMAASESVISLAVLAPVIPSSSLIPTTTYVTPASARSAYVGTTAITPARGSERV